MGKEKAHKKELLELLRIKSQLKQKVYDNTLSAFSNLKNLQEKISIDYNRDLTDVDERIKLNYEPRGEFESEFKVAGDLLFFSMHSNIFEFNREHHIWELPYVKENIFNSYCGIINIYNFLSDSFRYNRQEDLGYLITRIFVNHENHFFVEGKRQSEFSYKNFHKQVVTKEKLHHILEVLILYALQFDLLVPPYDEIKIVSVGQMNQKIQHSRLRTGKRMGFKFNSDDVSE